MILNNNAILKSFAPVLAKDAQKSIIKNIFTCRTIYNDRVNLFDNLTKRLEMFKMTHTKDLEARMSEFLESNPNIMFGKVVFKHSRVPVSLIYGYLANGKKPNEVLREYFWLDEKAITWLDHCVRENIPLEKIMNGFANGCST